MPNGFLSQLFGGTPQRQEQVSRFTPQQQEVLNKILQQAGGQLQQQPRGAQDILQPVFAQARKQFQEQTIPQLLEQFQAGGQLGSGRLQSSLAKGATDLESQIASIGAQAELGQAGQQQQLLSQLLGMGLQPQFDTIERPREPGIFERGTAGITEGLSGFGQFLPQLLGGAVGGLLGGPPGAAAGASGGGALITLLQQLLGGR